jgi:phosphotransferase system HPr-like phosphotransfer protein
MLAAGKGTRLRLTVTGCDEEEAAANLERLIAEGFGESE